MRPWLILIPAVFLLCRCSLVKNKDYEDKQLGWKMPIPYNANLMLEKHLDDYDKYPRPELYNEKQLLDFILKDGLNSLFMSMLTRFDKTPREWEVNQHEKDVEYFNGISKGMGPDEKCDSVTSNEKIGPAMFRVFNVKFHEPRYTYYHTTYARLVNGSTFTVLIQAGNEKDMNTILSAWKKSVFLK